jgi:hypothetical protein
MRNVIFTPGERRRAALRLNRRTAKVSGALQAMHRGEFLCLQYCAGQPRWSLTDGRVLSAEVANILVSNTSIAPASGALFDGMPGQTWKLVGGSND